MNDCGCGPISPYGELDDELKSEVEPLCKGKTIEQLRKIGDYFYNKASRMSEEINKSVTVEQFEKVLKKEDATDY